MMFRFRPGFFALCGFCLYGAPLFVAPVSHAQPIGFFEQEDGSAPSLPPGISVDGNRWVEVEVIVFRAEVNRSNEVANPGKLALSYFPNARPLWSPLDSYAYPFEADQPPAPLSRPVSAASGFGPQSLDSFNEFPDEPVDVEEPEFDFNVPAAPAVKGSFKVLDLARDPYVRLDGSSARLGGAARNLDQAPDYEVLWHETWRQPLLDRAQVGAVVVQAGEQVGEHTALEGSVRLSRAGERARLELNVWLNEFGIAESGDSALWQVPVVPEAARPKAEMVENEVNETDGPAPLQRPLALPEREIVRIWQVQASEDLTTGTLRYLDHPVVGVLIETRPYQLPEPIAPAPSEDF